SGEANRLSSTLLEILQRFHDASSALSTVLLEADLLDDLVKRGGTVTAADQVEAAVCALREGLRRFGVLLGEEESGSEAATRRGEAPVAPAVRAAIEQVARRFPGTRISLRTPSARASTAAAALRGGSSTIEQIVAELLKNACEGSGTRRASEVAVDVD